MVYIAGLNKKAEEFMLDSSDFISYKNSNAPNIGCKKSDGFVNTTASMYEKVKLNDNSSIVLFKHNLKNSIVVYETLQEFKDGIIFLSLKTDKGMVFEWTNDEIIAFIEKYNKL